MREGIPTNAQRRHGHAFFTWLEHGQHIFRACQSSSPILRRPTIVRNPLHVLYPVSSALNLHWNFLCLKGYWSLPLVYRSLKKKVKRLKNSLWIWGKVYSVKPQPRNTPVVKVLYFISVTLEENIHSYFDERSQTKKTTKGKQHQRIGMRSKTADVSFSVCFSHRESLHDRTWFLTLIGTLCVAPSCFEWKRCLSP